MEAKIRKIEPQSMDQVEFNNPVPKFDAAKLVKITEGKTKVVLEIPDAPNLVLLRAKDRITAFNAQRAHELDGKASLSNITTSLVFKYLNSVGLKTHFIKEYSETEFVAERCAMIPLEWITRRLATGSFLKRNPKVNEGYRFTPPKLEITFKDDDLGDPIWSEETVIESGLVCGGVAIGRREVELMSRVAVVVFEILEKAWARQQCTLVDMKVEFGINVEGDIVLADVIDSDSWRLWPNGDRRLQVDKQFYRDLSEVSADDLKQLKQNFKWVQDKLDSFVTAPVGRVVVLMGSASDEKHCANIRDECQSLGIPTELRVTSAHKGTTEALNTIAEYEGDGVASVIVAVAGQSNGLGPVASGNTTFPVINCPPPASDFGAHDVWSSLRTPSGLGCSTVLTPGAAALAAASCLALIDHMVWSRLRVRQLLNHIKLMKADRKMQGDNDVAAQRFTRSIVSTEEHMTNGTANGN